MFGSHVLETIIGIAFIFLIASVFASTINEGIASYLSLRAKDLESGLKNFLAEQAGPPQSVPVATESAAKAGSGAITAPAAVRAAVNGMGLASDILNLPAVQNLCAPKLFGDGVNKPSYLDAKTFSAALFDLLLPDAGNYSFAGLRASVQTLDNAELKSTLLPLIDRASGDMEMVRINIERAFNAMMDRLSGRYKRRAHMIILVIGLALAIIFNIDTVRATQRLWQEQTVRELVAAQANSFNAQAKTAPETTDEAAKLEAAYLNESLPIGWTAEAKKNWPSATMIIGWILTAIAVSFGAPFWFDFLNKTLGLNSRLAGNKPKANDTNG